ncbi:unnamed protein product, partial [Scytosiphon promiscuus]
QEEGHSEATQEEDAAAKEDGAAVEEPQVVRVDEGSEVGEKVAEQEEEVGQEAEGLATEGEQSDSSPCLIVGEEASPTGVVIVVGDEDSGKDKGDSKMLVSEGVEMERAEISGADLLLVKGQLEGVMDVKALDIERGAIVTGNVLANNVTVKGAFDGNMECRDLLIVRRGGTCSGKVSYAHMRVEPGANLAATMRLLSAADGSDGGVDPAVLSAVPVVTIAPPASTPAQGDVGEETKTAASAPETPAEAMDDETPSSSASTSSEPPAEIAASCSSSSTSIDLADGAEISSSSSSSPISEESRNGIPPAAASTATTPASPATRRSWTWAEVRAA